MRHIAAAAATLLLAVNPGLNAQIGPVSGPAAPDFFRPVDVFGLEWAADPTISPDGSRIAYVRSSNDIQRDGARTDLWVLRADGTDHRALTTSGRAGSPVWSPDGGRLLYVEGGEDGSQLWVRWTDTGQTARLTNLIRSPGALSWSPDGRWIAFSMLVPDPEQPFEVDLPQKPESAEWAPAMKVIHEMNYRADGAGYLEEGHAQIFLIPSEGGVPRQLTSGPWDHGGPLAWMPDSRSIVFSANRHENAEHDPLNSEVYRVTLDDGAVTQLTDRQGPDGNPAVSPDGRSIAYLGFDDRYQGYQITRLYVMNADGSDPRVLTDGWDRDMASPVWAADGRGIYVSVDDEGQTKIARVTLTKGTETLVDGGVSGLSLGRPYTSGSYSVARNGAVAFTMGDPYHPADVGLASSPAGTRRLTDLNADLLEGKKLGRVEEIWFDSSYDGRRIQGWVLTPPDFDPANRYPLILEIHGGPFAAYGPHFTAEDQLYAAAGYVVFYANPRGSTSYGEEFGNLIHHAYPGHDYDDLMSGVDAVIERGFVDPDRLFVTGGSGGGVLSAWIVGHTDRFRAAAVQKPVINWYSFVLNSDGPAFFYRYWFPGPPWEHERHYMERSPLAYVGNVSTPTLLITGEEDYRTPISESEQYYAALQIRGVPTALVRVPGASHGIANRPSHLIGKVAHILGWFEKWEE
ncbi:MAG: prolyl oligopeptidase family serine peptidase [Longimicrobiales bacterium]